MSYLSRPAPRTRYECHVLVLAKSPVAGQVKTRLCPPLSPDQAASLAAAALADTLEAVAACGASRRILALDGRPGDWLPPGFDVIPQRGTGLGERLAAAWSDAGGPGLQIGMDTPQVTPDLLDRCLAATFAAGTTASLGRSPDGGWWAIGMAERWDDDVFTAVPMSTSATATAQLRRLADAGHRVAELPWATDVDRMEDAWLVAEQAPSTRFARELYRVDSELGGVA